MKRTNEQIAMRVSLHTILGNIALTAFQLFAGIFGRSVAMVADAIHGLSDLISTIIVMIGIKLANQKPDKQHPYGHERFECVAAILLSAILFATGVGIGWAGLQQILEREFRPMAIPGLIALIAAVVGIVVKEAMYWYKRHAAKKINSSALMADAWHHRSDSLSSIGSFGGILGARLGFPILDAVAAIIICLFILKVAVDIFRDAVGKMTDKACDEQTEAAMRDLILEQASVVEVDVLKTRLFGDKIYVDVEISVDGSHTLCEAHDVAQDVHDVIEAAFPTVKHCTVHVNPAESDPGVEDDGNRPTD